jgi:nicotinamidase-related amidase
MHFNLRRQELRPDDGGHAYWQPLLQQVEWVPETSALLLCDVWDKHWCRGATERLDAMVERMDRVVQGARAQGVQIIHAPSGTMEFYADTPARQRLATAVLVEPPVDLERDDPPLPVDASDGGSDTGEAESFKAWHRQHPAIGIDQERDGISDNGREVYSFFQAQGITRLLIMGVHTNMCVLGRSFAIKQMVKWGGEVALIRDLTDAMYNPAKPPYVDHGEGTRLIVEYIEKFWCSTVASEELLLNF